MNFWGRTRPMCIGGATVWVVVFVTARWLLPTGVQLPSLRAATCGFMGVALWFQLGIWLMKPDR